MSQRDPLAGFQLRQHRCRNCGAELKMVDQGSGAEHRWMLYHAEPICEWFGRQRAARMRELEAEKAAELERKRLDLEHAEASQRIDRALAELYPDCCVACRCSAERCSLAGVKCCPDCSHGGSA